jgi:hypothetical protein
MGPRRSVVLGKAPNIEGIPRMTEIQQVQVEIAQPFASNPGEPTLDFTIPTTPGFSTGATISQATARELIKKLQATLDEIAGVPAA